MSWLAVLVLLAIVVAVVCVGFARLLRSGIGYEYTHEGVTYRVKYNHKLPKLTPWHEIAVTIGNVIYLKGDRMWPMLHAHEFCHVLQWKKYGRIEMSLYYLRGLIFGGYNKNHWAEKEAIKYAGENQHKFEFVPRHLWYTN